MHFLHKIVVHVFAVLGKSNNTVSKVFYVDHIKFANFRTHAGSTGIKHIMGSCFIALEDFCHFF